MIKKLTKHGNSYALVIDRGIMDLLKISEETDLNITTNGQSLLFTPLPKGKKPITFEEAVEISFKKFRGTYKRLAGQD